MTGSAAIPRPLCGVDLPPGWRCVPIEDVCEPRTGTRDPRDRPDSLFHYVDISCVDNVSKRIMQPLRLLGREAPSRARKVIRANDVIVSTTRPNLNAVAMVTSELDGQICSTGFCVLRASSAVLPEYLFAYSRTVAFIEPLAELVRGALYPAVTDKQVLSRSIPLAPLPEQKRIAALLNEQLTAVDRARDAANERAKAVRALPVAYLREVFESPAANSWPLRTIAELRKSGELAEHQDGNHGELHPRARDFIPSGVRFVTAKYFADDGTLSLGDAPCISASQSKGLRIGFANAGDVLLAHNATVGPVAMAPADCPGFIVGTSVTIFRADPGLLHPRYVFWALQSPLFQSQLDDAMEQTTRNQVPITRQRTMTLPIPDLATQRKTAAYLDARITIVWRVINASRSECTEIGALPAALLHRAFSGES